VCGGDLSQGPQRKEDAPVGFAREVLHVVVQQLPQAPDRELPRGALAGTPVVAAVDGQAFQLLFGDLSAPEVIIVEVERERG